MTKQIATEDKSTKGAVDSALAYLMSLRPEAQWNEITPCLARLIRTLRNSENSYAQHLAQELDDQCLQWTDRFRDNLSYGSRREIARQLIEIHKALHKNVQQAKPSTPVEQKSSTASTYATALSYFPANAGATNLPNYTPSAFERAAIEAARPPVETPPSAFEWLCTLFNDPYQPEHADSEIKHDAAAAQILEYLSTHTARKLLEIRHKLVSEQDQYPDITEATTDFIRVINRCIIAMSGGSKSYDVLPMYRIQITTTLKKI